MTISPMPEAGSPTVSIVIPTYNQAGLLKLALDSVRAQTFTDWEAIIVNNFSDDDTAAVVDGYGEPRFHRIDFRNHGVIAASRNKGIEAATGEWIAFLDSDDLWMAEKLEACVARADGLDLICHREATVRGGEVISVSPMQVPSRATYRRLLFEGNCFSPTAVMVRREALDAIGGFNETPAYTTCEDYDLWLRLAKSGVRVGFVDAVLSHYRLHESNSSASVERHMNAGLTVVDAHFDALEPRFALDPLRHRRRLARIIYGAGRSYQKSGAAAAARRMFARSLATYPFSAAAIACFFATLFGGAGERPQHG